MKTPVLITTPMPTTEDIARTYGISKKRQREIQRIVQEAAMRLEAKRARRKSMNKTAAQGAKVA